MKLANIFDKIDYQLTSSSLPPVRLLPVFLFLKVSIFEARACLSKFPGGEGGIEQCHQMSHGEGEGLPKCHVTFFPNSLS